MARGASLNEGDRDRVAAKIRELLPEIDGIRQTVGGGPIDLKESFELLFLPLDKVETAGSNVSISDLVVSTNKLRHQLSSGGTVTMSAETRTSSVGGMEPELSSIGIDEAAPAIDAVLDRIETDFPADTQVKILEVPAFQVSALLIQADRGDKVLVVVGPQRPDQYLSSAEFLSYLKSVGPSIGLSE